MPHNFGPLQPMAVKSGTDLSAKQFYLVKLSGNNEVDLVGAVTDRAFGILFNKPKSTGVDGASIMTLQGARCPAAMDGTTDIAAGDYLGPNAAGVLIKKATTDYSVCAQALEHCTTNGVEIHDVKWLGAFFWRTAGDA